MTYWADNIKFIKDIQDSKYKKIEDGIADLEEHTARLNEDKECKKHRDGFLESSRMLELMDLKEIEGLAETMFKDMPEADRAKEQDRLKEIVEKYTAVMNRIKADRTKFAIQ